MPSIGLLPTRKSPSLIAYLHFSRRRPQDAYLLMTTLYDGLSSSLMTGLDAFCGERFWVSPFLCNLLNPCLGPRRAAGSDGADVQQVLPTHGAGVDPLPLHLPDRAGDHLPNLHRANASSAVDPPPLRQIRNIRLPSRQAIDPLHALDDHVHPGARLDAALPAGLRGHVRQQRHQRSRLRLPAHALLSDGIPIPSQPT